MHILLVNDDGIKAKGLSCLLEALYQKHRITVAAPARQQSGMSHAVTVHRDIIVEREKIMEEKYGIEAWMIDGTPADCVKLYLEALQPKEDWPDVIISGINEGGNLGTDVIYSGTVGAAVEGYLHNISSLAVSLEYNSSLKYKDVASKTAELLPTLLNDLSGNALLNINFPRYYADNKADVVFTKVGKRDYLNAFQKEESDGKIIYRMEGEIIDDGNDEFTDVVQTANGKISVTALQTDMTDYTKFRQW